MNELKTTVSGQLQQLQMLMHRASFSQLGGMRSPHLGQGRVLALLRLKPEISQRELTYLLNMSKQAAAELIAKLERSGYITREPSQSDKRSMVIRLTEKGAAATDDTGGAMPDHGQPLDCLSEDELAAFSGYLARIITRYEEQFPGEDFSQRRKMMEAFMRSHGGGFGHGHHHPGWGFRGHGSSAGPDDDGRHPAAPGFSPYGEGGWDDEDDAR